MNSLCAPGWPHLWENVRASICEGLKSAIVSDDLLPVKLSDIGRQLA